MNAIASAFWSFLGLCLLVACFQACGDLMAESQPEPARYVPPDAARERAGCDGIIRVSAPYDLRPELEQASALAGNAVRFEQVASGGQDITVHERRYDGIVWARGAMPGREVWMDFGRVPAPWRARVLLHEFIHNAGFAHADGCDVMADPPQWCDGRPIVRAEYVRGLQRLARCQQDRPASIQATSAPAGIVTDYAPGEVE